MAIYVELQFIIIKFSYNTKKAYQENDIICKITYVV